MKTYAPIAALVTTRDGVCPAGYIEVESIIVNGGLQASVQHYKELATKWETEAKADLARVRELEAQVREARELLEHFQFIAHGPGCICDWCDWWREFLGRPTDGALDND